MGEKALSVISAEKKGQPGVLSASLTSRFSPQHLAHKSLLVNIKQ